jgi:hypothetical protein
VEYEPDFAKSFMHRTLEIARGYSGPYDATLLINCLLGLLIVPKETLIEKVPATPFDSLADWGIQPSSIKRPGKCEYGHEHAPNLRQLVRRMRNSVAHFRIEPYPKRGEVQGFTFRDRNGFYAVLSLSELQQFVVKLSGHLEGAA